MIFKTRDTRVLNKLKRHWRRLAMLACTALAIQCGVTTLKIYLSLDVYQEPLEDISCHYQDTDDTLPRADSESFLPPNRSIFFHETSCKGHLNSRQACAIESAARAHPEWQINVLFSGPVSRHMLKTDSLSVLRNIINVKLRRVHVVKYAKGTPLETMVSEGALNRSRWRIVDTSDVLRYLSLYKFGGVYLDLDVVVAKALDPLGMNWAARQSNDTVASGVLALSQDDIGRITAKAVLISSKNEYCGNEWASIGPHMITRILQQLLCSTTEPVEMSAATCNGFEVYGPQLFYPVHWSQAKDYFRPGEIKEEDTAYVFHVWNHLTSKLKVHKDSPYAKLAKKYCPNIYKLYDMDFGL